MTKLLADDGKLVMDSEEKRHRKIYGDNNEEIKIPIIKKYKILESEVKYAISLGKSRKVVELDEIIKIHIK